MSTEKKISRIVSSIVAHCSPEKVILFGLHAYGRPKRGSDIDLFIVADIPGLPAERVRKVRRAIKEHASVDIVVRSPKDIEISLKGRDWFLQEVFEKGKVLYARCNRSMVIKSRRGLHRCVCTGKELKQDNSSSDEFCGLTVCRKIFEGVSRRTQYTISQVALSFKRIASPLLEC